MLNRRPLALVNGRLADVQFGGNDKYRAVLRRVIILDDDLRANWST